MNGTPARRLVRSVQLAVLAVPTTSVGDAVAEARRRHDPRHTSPAEQAPHRPLPVVALEAA